MRGMTIIVKTITKILVGLIFLYGMYIIFHGHLTPGGGFAGGVIVSASFILLILAFGSEEIKERIGYIYSSIFESIGGLLFILIALWGIIIGSQFFYNFLPKGKVFMLFSSGIIPLCNVAIGIKVGAGLFAIFLAIAATRFIMKE